MRERRVNRFEPPSPVKRASLIVDRVDGDQSCGGVLGSECPPVKRFEQKARPESVPLRARVDG